MRAATLRTERLLLRRWRDGDREVFHGCNSDAAVMATIGPVMSRAESDAFLNRIEARFDDHGFGLWCVELDGDPIGFTGFMVPWFRDGSRDRLADPVGALGDTGTRRRRREPVSTTGFASVDDGGLGFDEVDLVHRGHQRQVSPRVMEKLGLQRDPDGDFDHPSVPAANPLRPHVLYRLRRPDRPSARAIHAPACCSHVRYPPARSGGQGASGHTMTTRRIRPAPVVG